MKDRGKDNKTGKGIEQSYPGSKNEVETKKKTQRETILEIENLGKRSVVIEVSIANRVQEIGERILGADGTIENIDTTVKENTKSS